MKFMIIFLLVFAIFHIFVYHFLFRYAFCNLSLRTKIIAFLALLCNYLLIVSFRFLRDSGIDSALFILISLSITLALILFVAAGLNFVFLIISHFVENLRIYRPKIAGFMIILAIVSVVYGYLNASRLPKLVEQDIFIPNLQKEMTILQITDLHLSKLLPREKLRGIVSMANATNADIIVLVGDIIDSKERDLEPLLPLLKELRAKYGVFFALGNHEFIYDANKSLDFIRSIGITPLVNSNIVIDNNINLIGISDLVGERFGYLQADYEASMRGVSENLPKILLSHQPNAINLIDSRIDLMLSGHTHAGQIFPFSILVYFGNPFLYGLKTINQTQIYISQGANLSVTYARILTRAEVNLIHLRSENE